MRRHERGFSFIEVLVALFLMSLGVLAVAPMFVYAMEGNASGADFGAVGALAVERSERLRQQDYNDLDVGGSLTADTTDYYDDSHPDVLLRWEIEANASPSRTKLITVRAIAKRDLDGPRREVTLVTLRGY